MTLSVTELLLRLKQAVEQEATDASVCGEIGSCKTASSGHIYFTLKDTNAQLQCVLYRYQALMQRVQLREGIQVELTGKATVWEGRGALQFIVSSVREAGKGTLQQQFEQLKRKLEAEGLFDAERKRRIPPYPTAVGLITSATGAVIQDMRHRLESRAPWMQAYLYPVPVQGKGAELGIARAIQRWNTADSGLPPVDYLIIARGGGSLEDLWCFNEEQLARAIAASRIPIVSAVGHETDFTIADFVADLRAPTPTAAIELTTPDGPALDTWFRQADTRLTQALARALETAKLRLRAATQGKLSDPQAIIGPFSQKLDIAEEDLQHAITTKLDTASTRLHLLEAKLSTRAATDALRTASYRLQSLTRQLQIQATARLTQARATLQTTEARLRAADPRQALERGFALVRTPEGRLARRADELTPGDPITITLGSGELGATITSVRPG